MRALLLKYFFLDYLFNIFGYKCNGVRAGVIIIPLMITNGLFAAYSQVNWLTMIPLIISLLIAFVYTKVFPIKVSEWHLLDESQKFQYGSHQESMTVEMFNEWVKIYTKYNSI